MNETMIERRLEAVERSIAELQHRIAGATPQTNWVDQVIRSITDEEVFLQVLEYGRAFRKADQPDADEAPGES